jgi:hypothetical protein
MIDLGTTDFLIVVPSLPRIQFEEYSTQLFDVWEVRVSESLAREDDSLALEVDEGSIKGHSKIAAALTVVYFGIGNYGDFVSGLQTIGNQVSAARDFLSQRAASFFESRDHATKARKHTGTLGKLQRLFDKVQRREITAEGAMREAEMLLGEEASSAPDFMRELRESLANAPLFPQQIPLVLDAPLPEALSLDRDIDRQPRPSRPKRPVPPLHQLRVEVWRESKKGQRRCGLLNSSLLPNLGTEFQATAAKLSYVRRCIVASDS